MFTMSRLDLCMYTHKTDIITLIVVVDYII
jgi:hypothetical protein